MRKEQRRRLMETLREFRARGRYDRCIDLLDALPEGERNYETDLRLAKALRRQAGVLRGAGRGPEAGKSPSGGPEAEDREKSVHGKISSENTEKSAGETEEEDGKKTVPGENAPEDAGKSDCEPGGEEKNIPPAGENETDNIRERGAGPRKREEASVFGRGSGGDTSVVVGEDREKSVPGENAPEDAEKSADETEEEDGKKPAPGPRGYGDTRAGRLAARAVEVLKKYEAEKGEDPNFNYAMAVALLASPDTRREATVYAERRRRRMPGTLSALNMLSALMRADPDNEYARLQRKPLKIYTRRQARAVEEHIAETFGDAPLIFSDPLPEDIKLDIFVIPPTRERNYYILVTFGAGAMPMKVPEELLQRGIRRAEYLICLPPWWKFEEKDMEDNRWYWPLALLKSVARLPIDRNTWLGWGHSMGVAGGRPYDGSVGFCGSVLLACGDFPGGGICPIPGGERVVFYQVVPLYPRELEFKTRHGVSALLDRFADSELKYCDPKRPDVTKRAPLRPRDLLDSDERHIEKIKSMRLPVDIMNAYNHMAAYIIWAIENYHISPSFYLDNRKLTKAVIKKDADFDIRSALRYGEKLAGKLRLSYFNREGRKFAARYFGEDSGFGYNFFDDVDEFALKTLGVKRHREPSYRDEEYLFLSWGRDYVRGLGRIISSRYRLWAAANGIKQRPDSFPGYLRGKLSAMLGGDCFFRSPTVPSLLEIEFTGLREKARRRGKIPFMVSVNSALRRTLAAGRPRPIPREEPGRLEKKKKRRLAKRLGEAGLSMKRYMTPGPGRREPEALNGFSGHLDYFSKKSLPSAMALIPADDPVSALERLPLGQGSPGEERLRAARILFYRYGALPAVMSRNLLEFYLPRLPGPEEAAGAAALMLAFYPEEDLPLEAGAGAALARQLAVSHVWQLPFDSGGLSGY